MKKLMQSLFMLMTASIVVTAPISVYAKDAAATKEESSGITSELMGKIEKGLQKARAILPHLNEYPITEVELNGANSRVKVKLYQSDKKTYPHFIFTFDQKTGELLTFIQAKGEKSDSTYPLEKSKEKAIAFMKNWYGDDMGGYRLNPSMSDSNLSITFNKTVNGIPVRNDAVILSVDSLGQIVGKGIDGNQRAIVVSEASNLRFADPQEALTNEQMEKAFASLMKPTYTLDADGKTYRLLYAPHLSGEIDARTGLDRSPVKSGMVVPFQPKGNEPKAKSKAEAAAFLAAHTGYDFTKGRTVFEEKSDADRNVTSYLWRTENGVIGNVFVETTTGVIRNYQVLDTNPNRQTDKKLNAEQALEIAVAKMSEFLPLDIKEMVLTETDRYDSDNNLYMFDFVLEHQGIMVSDWRTQAHVDAATGKVLLLDWKLPQQVALPDPKKAISPEEAARIYLKDHPLELYYSLDDEKEGSFSLVYVLTGEEWEVDASTGRPYIYGQE